MKLKNRRLHRPSTVVRNGRTYDVTEEVTVREPVFLDMMLIVRRAVSVATIAVVLVAMIWSVVSIGSLLSASAPGWVAYLAAGAFDLSWAVCMAAEWTLQYDRRARIPRRAGWAALAVSMTAIATHGALTASVWIGVIGAVISLLAKGLWTVLMMITARPLSAVDQQIVEIERSEAASELALVTVRRELIRTRKITAAMEQSGSLIEAEWAAAGLTRQQLADSVLASISNPPDPDPDRSAESIDPESMPDVPPERNPDPVTPIRRSGSVKDSVRELFEAGTTEPDAVVAALPDANPETVKRMVRMMRTARDESTGQYL